VTAAKLPKGDGGEGIGGIALSFSQAVVSVGGVGVLVEGAEQGGGWKAVSSREVRRLASFDKFLRVPLSSNFPESIVF